jgi:sugar phosphate isomerase/epimerase
MKLGANSVLFGTFDMETAFKYVAMAGYDGIELMAVEGHAEHLVLGRWRELAPEIKRYSQDYGLELLAIEKDAADARGTETAFQAAVELGIPVVACGSGGKSDDDGEWPRVIDKFGNLARVAERYGVTLCVKAHVGASIYNTATMLRAMSEIDVPALGLNMDPSHIHRAGENPAETAAAVISHIKHVHIRDCKGRQHGPGDPADQANGRGDIDLVGFIRVLHEHGYTGALDLEVIGTRRLGHTLEQCCVIAAEARGHMQACLQACGAR